MRSGKDRTGVRAGRILPALMLAALLALGTALPVFAQEGTTAEGSAPQDGTSGGDGAVQPQVVGGEPVPNGELPFVVSLQFVRGGQTSHFCGGSLLDNDSVLTAAHCADLITRRNSGTTIDFRDVRVVVGRTDLRSDQGQVRRIPRLADVEEHPNFDIERTGYRFDAAVIDLNNPVNGTVIALAPTTSGNSLERPGRRAAVAGWGNTVQQDPDFSQPDRFPSRLQRAYPPIVSDREGERVYGRQYVAPIMVSAGKPGVDTCQGDSGGPMWVNTEDGRRQIGITSFGFGCGAKNFPGVYAEVNNPSISNFITSASTD